MLKNLFNNPWFIGGLGAFATIYLGWSIIQPLMGEDLPVADADTFLQAEDLEPSGAQRPQSTVEHAQLMAAQGRETIGWLHDIDRDPFSGIAVETDNQQLPKVGALFVSEGVRAAVIDNRLVRIGDQIAQYTVVNIAEDHVALRRAGQNLRLEPEV